MGESVRHICWIKATYQIEKRGKKWFYGVNTTPGQKPHRDKIEINEFSAGWQVGQEVNLFAIHSDDISQYEARFFHKVTLFPVSEDAYYAAPARAQF